MRIPFHWVVDITAIGGSSTVLARGLNCGHYVVTSALIQPLPTGTFTSFDLLDSAGGEIAPVGSGLSGAMSDRHVPSGLGINGVAVGVAGPGVRLILDGYYDARGCCE